MTPRSTSPGYGLLIAAGIIFGGLAVTLYAMGLSEVAVVPTIAAVAAAVVTVIKAVVGTSGPEDENNGEPTLATPPDGTPGLPARRTSPETGTDADVLAAAETEVQAR